MIQRELYIVVGTEFHRSSLRSAHCVKNGSIRNFTVLYFAKFAERFE